MTKLKLFLDLDGVFVDFHSGMKDMLNMTYPKERMADTDFKKFQELMGFKIWSRKFFWQDLKELPNCQEMYAYFAKYNPDILTAFPDSYTINSVEALTTEAEKTMWVRQHFGKLQATRLFCTKAKLKQLHVSTTPDVVSVLIDDRPSNINEWIESGGIGILHTSMDDTIKQFENLFSNVDFYINPTL